MRIIIMFLLACCFSDFLLAIPIRKDIAAAITEEQRALLTPNQSKITQAVPILIQDLRECQTTLAETRMKLQVTEQKLQTEDSFLSRQKLKVQSLYYEERVADYEKKCEQKALQLVIYRYVSSLLNNESVAPEQIRQDKPWLSKIEERATWAIAQQNIAYERWESAQARLQVLPSEQKQAEQAIENLNKQLEVLEYKKSWSNLKDRLEIQSLIGFERAKLSKLEAEIFIQDQIKQDSWSEIQAMKLEQTEAEVAAIVLRKS